MCVFKGLISCFDFVVVFEWKGGCYIGRWVLLGKLLFKWYY